MNGLTSPKAGVTDWPPGPITRAARGAPEPSDAFAGILDSHQARTATAEGQDKSPKTKGRDRQDDGPVASERAEARSNAEWARERRAADGVEREHGKTTDPVTEPEVEQPAVPPAEGEASEPAAEPVTVEPVTAEPVTAEPVVQAPVVPVALLVQPVTAAPVEGELVAPRAQAQAAVATPVAPPPQQQVAEATAVQPATQVQAAVADADGVPAEVVAKLAQEPAAKAQVPAQERAAVPAQQAIANATPGQPKSGSTAADSSPKHDQPGTLPQQASEQARTVAQAYGRVADQSRAAEAPVAQPSGAPVASPASPVLGTQHSGAANGAPKATPVPLARAAENVEHVLKLASSRGVTHARIALNPAELGSIDVHMRHTNEGIVATVVAHAPEAVQQLQNAAQDLRRTLEQQGLNLLSLDIGQSGDDRAAGRAGSDAGEQHSDRDGQADGVADADGEVTVKTNLQLPNGVLVDVLA